MFNARRPRGKGEKEEMASSGYKIIKKKLLQMREELLSEISSSVKSESNLLKSEIGDVYDLASSERERELNLLLCEKDRQKLAQIDEALRRIQQGTYGVCDNCGEKIAKARLLAMPFTHLCISCKTEEEKLAALEKKYEEEESPYRETVFTEEEES